jgi:hypothetical protein
VAHSLNVVAIKIADEHSVVAGVVLRPESRRMQDVRAGCNGRCVHPVDRVPIGRAEGYVRFAPGGPGFGTEPKVRKAVRSRDADDRAVLARIPHRLLEAKISEHSQIKCRGGVDVGGLQSDVVQHASERSCRSIVLPWTNPNRTTDVGWTIVVGVQLDEAEWRSREHAHRQRIGAATAAYLGRRTQARKHPVEDFLFVYYSHRPAQLRRWHPGAGVRLAGEAARERADWKYYRHDGAAAFVDIGSFLAARSITLAFVRDLLAATSNRSAHFGCLGLHEWAMVYRLTPEQVRHADWPLRLGVAGTDQVVESHQLKCSHVDAYRFFTPPARSLNVLTPARETQVAMEQPGCLHANMDLYKWAYKLSPAVGSDLTADCFDLAREIRELDMRASPYDLTELGFEPIAIETPAGKAEYVAAQQTFAQRAQVLRARLIEACDAIANIASSVR